MKKNALFVLWGGLFGLCAALGFIPEPTGALKGLMVSAAVLFFLPGWLLFAIASREGDRMTLTLLRNLSIASLLLTVVLLIANFLSVFFSETLGNILHYILTIVSTPMICGQYWVLSLFLWACLMTACMGKLKTK